MNREQEPLHPLHLAECLWLGKVLSGLREDVARQDVPEDQEHPDSEPDPVSPKEIEPSPEESGHGTDDSPKSRIPEEQTEPEPEKIPAEEIGIEEGGSDPQEATSGVPTTAQSQSMPSLAPLENPLAYSRALHRMIPLKEVPGVQEIDIEKTVKFSAAAGKGIHPVLVEKRERKGHLVILEATGLTQSPWKSTVDRLVTIARGVGAYRDVQRVPLQLDSQNTSEEKETPLESSLRLALRPGRPTMVLLVHDGVDDTVENGELGAFLEQQICRVDTQARLAWLHPWPQQHWDATAVEGLFRRGLGSEINGELVLPVLPLGLSRDGRPGIAQLERWLEGIKPQQIPSYGLPIRPEDFRQPGDTLRPVNEEEDPDWLDRFIDFSQATSETGVRLLGAAMVATAVADISVPFMEVLCSVDPNGKATDPEEARFAVASAISSGFFEVDSNLNREKTDLIRLNFKPGSREAIREFLAASTISEVINRLRSGEFRQKVQEYLSSPHRNLADEINWSLLSRLVGEEEPSQENRIGPQLDSDQFSWVAMALGHDEKTVQGWIETSPGSFHGRNGKKPVEGPDEEDVREPENDLEINAEIKSVFDFYYEDQVDYQDVLRAAEVDWEIANFFINTVDPLKHLMDFRKLDEKYGYFEVGEFSLDPMLASSDYYPENWPLYVLGSARKKIEEKYKDQACGIVKEWIWLLENFPTQDWLESNYNFHETDHTDEDIKTSVEYWKEKFQKLDPDIKLDHYYAEPYYVDGEVKPYILLRHVNFKLEAEIQYLCKKRKAGPRWENETASEHLLEMLAFLDVDQLLAEIEKDDQGQDPLQFGVARQFLQFLAISIKDIFEDLREPTSTRPGDNSISHIGRYPGVVIPFEDLLSYGAEKERWHLDVLVEIFDKLGHVDLWQETTLDNFMFEFDLDRFTPGSSLAHGDLKAEKIPEEVVNVHRWYMEIKKARSLPNISLKDFDTQTKKWLEIAVPESSTWQSQILISAAASLRKRVLGDSQKYPLELPWYEKIKNKTDHDSQQYDAEVFSELAEGPGDPRFSQAFSVIPKYENFKELRNELTISSIGGEDRFARFKEDNAYFDRRLTESPKGFAPYIFAAIAGRISWSDEKSSFYTRTPQSVQQIAREGKSCPSVIFECSSELFSSLEMKLFPDFNDQKGNSSRVSPLRLEFDPSILANDSLDAQSKWGIDIIVVLLIEEMFRWAKPHEIYEKHYSQVELQDVLDNLDYLKMIADTDAGVSAIFLCWKKLQHVLNLLFSSINENPEIRSRVEYFHELKFDLAGCLDSMGERSGNDFARLRYKNWVSEFIQQKKATNPRFQLKYNPFSFGDPENDSYDSGYPDPRTLEYLANWHLDLSETYRHHLDYVDACPSHDLLRKWARECGGAYDGDLISVPDEFPGEHWLGHPFWRGIYIQCWFDSRSQEIMQSMLTSEAFVDPHSKSEEIEENTEGGVNSILEVRTPGGKSVWLKLDDVGFRGGKEGPTGAIEIRWDPEYRLEGIQNLLPNFDLAKTKDRCSRSIDTHLFYSNEFYLKEMLNAYWTVSEALDASEPIQVGKAEVIEIFRETLEEIERQIEKYDKQKFAILFTTLGICQSPQAVKVFESIDIEAGNDQKAWEDFCNAIKNHLNPNESDLNDVLVKMSTGNHYVSFLDQSDGIYYYGFPVIDMIRRLQNISHLLPLEICPEINGESGDENHPSLIEEICNRGEYDFRNQPFELPSIVAHYTKCGYEKWHLLESISKSCYVSPGGSDQIYLTGGRSGFQVKKEDRRPNEIKESDEFGGAESVYLRNLIAGNEGIHYLDYNSRPEIPDAVVIGGELEFDFAEFLEKSVGAQKFGSKSQRYAIKVGNEMLWGDKDRALRSRLLEFDVVEAVITLAAKSGVSYLFLSDNKPDHLKDKVLVSLSKNHSKDSFESSVEDLTHAFMDSGKISDTSKFVSTDVLLDFEAILLPEEVREPSFEFLHLIDVLIQKERIIQREISLKKVEYSFDFPETVFIGSSGEFSYETKNPELCDLLSRSRSQVQDFMGSPLEWSERKRSDASFVKISFELGGLKKVAPFRHGYEIHGARELSQHAANILAFWLFMDYLHGHSEMLQSDDLRFRHGFDSYLSDQPGLDPVWIQSVFSSYMRLEWQSDESDPEANIPPGLPRDIPIGKADLFESLIQYAETDTRTVATQKSRLNKPSHLELIWQNAITLQIFHDQDPFRYPRCLISADSVTGDRLLVSLRNPLRELLGNEQQWFDREEFDREFHKAVYWIMPSSDEAFPSERIWKAWYQALCSLISKLDRHVVENQISSDPELGSGSEWDRIKKKIDNLKKKPVPKKQRPRVTAEIDRQYKNLQEAGEREGKISAFRNRNWQNERLIQIRSQLGVANLNLLGKHRFGQTDVILRELETRESPATRRTSKKRRHMTPNRVLRELRELLLEHQKATTHPLKQCLLRFSDHFQGKFLGKNLKFNHLYIDSIQDEGRSYSLTDLALIEKAEKGFQSDFVDLFKNTEKQVIDFLNTPRTTFEMSIPEYKKWVAKVRLLDFFRRKSGQRQRSPMNHVAMAAYTGLWEELEASAFDELLVKIWNQHGVVGRNLQQLNPYIALLAKLYPQYASQHSGASKFRLQVIQVARDSFGNIEARGEGLPEKINSHPFWSEFFRRGIPKYPELKGLTPTGKKTTAGKEMRKIGPSIGNKVQIDVDYSKGVVRLRPLSVAPKNLRRLLVDRDSFEKEVGVPEKWNAGSSKFFSITLLPGNTQDQKRWNHDERVRRSLELYGKIRKYLKDRM